MKLTKRKEVGMMLQNKITKLLMAAILCIGIIIMPIQAFAEPVAEDPHAIEFPAAERPDTVGLIAYPEDEDSDGVEGRYILPTIVLPSIDAEFVGSLLRIHPIRGSHEIHAVYINGIRFIHRPGTTVAVDISRYITSGEPIIVVAVDTEGYASDVMMLSPPPRPQHITPEGQAEVIDHIIDADNIEFITISTPAGNIFHLIIDHGREGNNVYFLNAVTEWDLIQLAADAELPQPPQQPPQRSPAQNHLPDTNQQQEMPPQPEPTPPQHTQPEDITQETEEPSRVSLREGIDPRYVIVGIFVVVALGVVAYTKLIKQKQIQHTDFDDEEMDSEDEYEDMEEIEEVEENE